MSACVVSADMPAAAGDSVVVTAAVPTELEKPMMACWLPGLKPVPAEPEDHHAQHEERAVVAGEGVDLRACTLGGLRPLLSKMPALPP